MRFLKVQKAICLVLAFIAILSLFVTPDVAFALICPHKETKNVTLVSASCISHGQDDVICVKCNKVLESYIYEPVEHEFENYTIAVEPTAKKNGIERSQCSNCNTFDEREYICPHIEKHDIVVNDPTCVSEGQKNIVCDKCSAVIESNPIPMVEHLVENYNITVIPTATENGIQSGTCSTCSDIIEIEYVCPHKETKRSVIKKPTCCEEGVEASICALCTTVLEKHALSVADCSYGDWVVVENATPFKKGEKCRTCSYCGNVEYSSFDLSLGNNYIYIPNTSVVGSVTHASFTQSAVDKYDMIYSYAFEFGKGENDPFIIGHSTGTLNHLDEVNVGQYIYISVNGNVQTYEVVVSEFAMQNDSWTDIVGQTTGHSVWDNLGCKTLHMYTCYGRTNDRWLVLAKLVN